jgi:diacylglycerol kinase
MSDHPLTKWQKNFRYAYDGIKYALDTQRHMKFHFIVGLIVLFAAFFLGLDKIEILFILLAITLIIVTELMNTAIEKTVDLAMPDIHPLAKIAKDVAAASVLVASFFAVWVGIIVFYDPIDRLIQTANHYVNPFQPGTIWVLIAIILLTTIIIETRFSDKGKFVKPSMLTAIAFSMATLITLYVQVTFIALMTFTLASMLLAILYDKKSRSMVTLLFGAIIGSTITMFVYVLILI